MELAVCLLDGELLAVCLLDGELPFLLAVCLHDGEPRVVCSHDGKPHVNVQLPFLSKEQTHDECCAGGCCSVLSRLVIAVSISPARLHKKWPGQFSELHTKWPEHVDCYSLV